MSGPDSANILNRLEMSHNLRGSLQRAVTYAYEQAHTEVTLEHLLLALAEDRDAAVILHASRVDVSALVTEVSDYLGRLEDRVSAEGARQPALGRDVVHIFQSAGAAAQKSQRRAVGSALVLAAIVGDGRSAAAQMLRNHGLTFEQAIDALRRANAAAAARPVAQPEPAPQPSVAMPAAEPPPAAQPPRAAPADPSGTAQAVPRPASAASPPPSAQAARDILAGARERIAAARSQVAGQTQPATDEAPPPAAADRDPAPRLDAADPARQGPPAAAIEHRPATPADAPEPAVADASPRPDPQRPVHPPPAAEGPSHAAPAPSAAQPPASQPSVSQPSVAASPSQDEPRPAPRPQVANPPAPSPAPPPPAPPISAPPVAPPAAPAQAQQAPSPAPSPPSPAEFARPAAPRRPPPARQEPRPAAPDPRPPLPPHPSQQPPVPQPSAGPSPAAPPRYQGEPRPARPPAGAPGPGPNTRPPPAAQLPAHPDDLHPAMAERSTRPGRPPAPDPRTAPDRHPGRGPAYPPERHGERHPDRHPGHAGQMPPPPGYTTGRPERQPSMRLPAGASEAAADEPGDMAALDPRTLTAGVPTRMRVGRAVTVDVRVPRRQLEAWSGAADAASRAQHVITKAMAMRLKGPPGEFTIESASPETQWSDGYGGPLSDDIVSWRWVVTPRRSGRLNLQLSGATRIVGRDGLAAERPLPPQRATVRVAPDYLGFARRAAVLLLIAVGAGALGYYGEGLFDMGRAVLAQIAR